MKFRNYLLAAGCVLALCGCTKSNIVDPGFNSENPEPDTELYFNLELDLDQLREDVNDIALDDSDYPMAVSVDYTDPEEETPMDVTYVLKDETPLEEVGWYADEVLKVINDQVVAQDRSYASSREEYFGGLYQDKEVNLKVYLESDYPDGDAIIDATIPADSYMDFQYTEDTEEEEAESAQ